jgi:L-asparaginase
MPNSQRVKAGRKGLPRILVIYTGGTFGMDSAVKTSGRGAAANPTVLRVSKLDPKQLRARLLKEFPNIGVARCDIDVFLNRDSAHVGPADWVALAARIRSKWKKYDGVVVLHGTDTLAYTASALSFLLRPCRVPVVLTGAQLPLAALLTDARRNLLSAIEVAAYGPKHLLNQVSVFFDDRLLQGNRTRKQSASDFGAFESPASEALAWVGTTIRYQEARVRPISARPALVSAFSDRVLLLRVTPGFPSRVIRAGVLPAVDALVLQIFASGTAPTHDPEFIALLREARAARIPVVIVGSSGANPSVYEAGRALLREGCIWAGSMTPECAYVKTMLLLEQPEVRKRGLVAFVQAFRRDLAREGI